jgi:dienelactone hydrolase
MSAFLTSARRLVAVAALAGGMAGSISACTKSRSSVAPSEVPAPAPAAPTLDGLTIAGDPASGDGARWSLRTVLDGVAIDVDGVLLKPAGAGPFPAVVISHGLEQGPFDYGVAVAREMRQWGLVAIGPSYTHALGGARGAPGTGADNGASDANVRRALAARHVLSSLAYVDRARLALHGHSAGAFVTTAVLAAAPGAFAAASHTAGGASDDLSRTRTRPPSEAVAAAVRTPYQLHHGDRDPSVPLAFDQRLLAILRAQGVAAELHVYPGADHDSVERHAQMFERVQRWYAQHGVLGSR